MSGATGDRALGSARLTHALAERAVALSYEELPADVAEIARQGLLDWFGVALAGSREQAPRMLLETLLEGGAGDASKATTVVGHTAFLPSPRAALVNGTSAHTLDFDDVNLAFLGHASVAVLPAVLALAEERGSPMSEVIAAYVAGYETTCRFAAALGPGPYVRGFHATGTIGTLGAAAACARLLELDAATGSTALGIAASEASGLKRNFGTMTKALHAGRASEGGLLAALLAGRGFTASADAIEGPQGLAEASGGFSDADAALAEPPSGWYLRDNLFKHHASCFFTHSAIEGLRRLAASGEVPASEVRRVTLHVGELERGACSIPEPATGLEVKFSIAHLAAMALLGRSTARITDADAEDEEAIELRSRVILVEDGAGGGPTLVEVRRSDGETLTAQYDASAPERDLDAQRGRLREKFVKLAEEALGPRHARRLLDALEDLDGERDVRALMALTRPS